MLWCPSCQLEAVEGKKFCKICGAPLQEKELVTAPAAAAGPNQRRMPLSRRMDLDRLLSVGRNFAGAGEITLGPKHTTRCQECCVSWTADELGSPDQRLSLLRRASVRRSSQMT